MNIDKNFKAHILWVEYNGSVVEGLFSYATNKTNEWKNYLVSDDQRSFPGPLVIDDNNKGHIAMYYLQDPDHGLVLHLESENIIIGIHRIETNVPKEFKLNQNFPNPFNPSTNISFDLSNEGNVLIKIYNVLGKEVDKLVDMKLGAGSYSIIWNAEGLSSGIYFYSIEVKQNENVNFFDRKKMVFVK